MSRRAILATVVSVVGSENQPAVQLRSGPGESVVTVGQVGRPGRISMYNAAGQSTVKLTACDATIEVGGHDVFGVVSVLDKYSHPAALLASTSSESSVTLGENGIPGRIIMYNSTGPTVDFTASDATLSLGNNEVTGKVSLLDEDGKPFVGLYAMANESIVDVGQKRRPGRIVMYNYDGLGTVVLTADDSKLVLGAKDVNGAISIVGNSEGLPLVELRGRQLEDAESFREGEVIVRRDDNQAIVEIGGDKSSNEKGEYVNGHVLIRGGDDQAIVDLAGFSVSGEEGEYVNGEVIVRANGQPAVLLKPSSNESVINLGVKNYPGRISVHGDDWEAVRINAGGANQTPGISIFHPDTTEAIRLDGPAGSVVLRNSDGSQDMVKLDGPAGSVVLRNSDGSQDMVKLNGPAGSVVLRNSDGNESVVIDGQAGDITLQNSDCAEDFEVRPTEQIEPGMVVTLNDAGKLEQGSLPYDKRVVGVVSGGGDRRPGLVLGRQPDGSDRVPIALIGRVYCKVDANYAPIEVGDLVTTSATLGHAMKATDPVRSFGAVLGKALAPLARGRGMIPILVALQ
jgi:hypothetical protein